MADIHVQSELIQGPVRVAVLETDLPIPGVTFLLGNNLAGHGIIPDVVVREKPVNESPTAKLDQEKPHIVSVCVVTRSKTVSVAVDSPSLSHRDTLFSQVMNRENIIRGQKEDPSLAKLRHIADDKPINGYVEPLCLRPAGAGVEGLLGGRQPEVAGWGLIETGQTANILQKASLPFVNKNTCNPHYDNTLLPEQIGIVSRGKDSRCGVIGIPAVYTHVAAYRTWITQNLRA
ncbi:hypothetical protein Pcinc_007744 [Petrolisthes cinctipes]|uniref:Peptidase S1 domain-containing protein n=1 Tax=Petrolisthes cinctipes TaxID=88211 RepID=A0AAE1GEQ7_PETCI|nr:hypothetical protein Pcinc_007744 [Petrolisthes cinctipes]